MSTAPVVSVVVVADHGVSLEAVHTDLRSCFRGLAAQDLTEPVEFLLVESAEDAGRLPAELFATLPGVRVVPVESRRSYDLKNAGVAAARADVVMLLDADCTPGPGWLRAAVEHLREHPEVSVVTGRIAYEDRGLVSRALGLLSRAHEDRDRIARARFISNANGGFRRETFLRYPLAPDAGPFSGLLQSEAMWRDGTLAHFVPAIETVHAFEGWPMERDIRNQIGHSTIAVRRLDTKMRFAWMVRLGPVSIVPFTLLRTLDSWWNCVRSARAYGIRWWELPATLALALVVHAFEVPGMWNAFRSQPTGPTEYR